VRKGKEGEGKKESFFTSLRSPFATESKVSTLKETRVVSPIERHSTCAFVPFLSLSFSLSLSFPFSLQRCALKSNFFLVAEYLIEAPCYNFNAYIGDI